MSAEGPKNTDTAKEIDLPRDIPPEQVDPVVDKNDPFTGRNHPKVEHIIDALNSVPADAREVGVTAAEWLPRRPNKEERRRLRDVVRRWLKRVEEAALDQVVQFQSDIPNTFGLGVIQDKRIAGEAIRYPIPVRIWLSEVDIGDDVHRSVVRVLEAYGFEVVHEFPPYSGSWGQNLVARLRRVATSNALKKRLHKMERAVEAATLRRADADADEKQGKAVAALLTSLEKSNEALIQIGTILIIKIDGVPIVRNLTSREIDLIQEDPGLLKDPVRVLKALEEAARRLTTPLEQADVAQLERSRSAIEPF